MPSLKKHLIFPPFRTHHFRTGSPRPVFFSLLLILVSLSARITSATRRRPPDGFSDSSWARDPSMVRVFDDARPTPLLTALRGEINELDKWAKTGNWFGTAKFGGIPPDFWYDPRDPPRIRCEEAIHHLVEIAFPTPPGQTRRGWEEAGIIGAEWWPMLQESVDGLGMHHDKDECVFRDNSGPTICKERLQKGEGREFKETYWSTLSREQQRKKRGTAGVDRNT